MKPALLTSGAGVLAGALVAGALQNPNSQAAARTDPLPMAQPQLEKVAYLPDAAIDSTAADPRSENKPNSESKPDSEAPAGKILASTAPVSETPASDAPAGETPGNRVLAAPATGITAIGKERAGDPQPALRSHQITVARGDTLMRLLVKAGIDRPQAHGAITAMRGVFDPRDLKIGQEIKLQLRQIAFERQADGSPADGSLEEGQTELVSMKLRSSPEQDIQVTRGSGGSFAANAMARSLNQVLNLASGSIDYSLSKATREAGVPANILVAAIRAFSFDVDFQRDIQPGDAFELFYETFEDPEGRHARTGRLLYGSMILSGVQLEIFRHSPAEGEEDYFDAKGQSVRKALLRTPIDGARISSGYGKRRHPVLGYTKMHRGVDFAAPKGTPIYAAGKGVVEYAGRNGAYGKYVRIRHSGEFKSAYAHMNGIAKGIARGQRVKQGQVIGYVGSTGRSTGPHLHYEVLRGGKQTNPRNMKLPAGPKLAGKALERFLAARAETDRMRAAAEVRQVVQAQ